MPSYISWASEEIIEEQREEEIVANLGGGASSLQTGEGQHSDRGRADQQLGVTGLLLQSTGNVFKIRSCASLHARGFQQGFPDGVQADQQLEATCQDTAGNVFKIRSCASSHARGFQQGFPDGVQADQQLEATC